MKPPMSYSLNEMTLKGFAFLILNDLAEHSEVPKILSGFSSKQEFYQFEQLRW